jgi:hypothetical protein
MAHIMIKCPMFAMAVPTGVTTEAIILDALDFPLTMQCQLADNSIAGLDRRRGSRKKIVK